LAMKRCAWPVSMHSVGVVLDRVGHAVQQPTAHRCRHVAPGLEGARRRGGGAIDIFRLAARDRGEHRIVHRRFGLKGLAGDRRHGLAVDHVADAVGAQLLQQRRGAARSRLACKTSAGFGVTLSMGSLHFQNIVDVVAFPVGFLVVDLHVERQRERARGENRIEIGRQHLEDVLAGFLAGREVAAFA
jgi:hypothetical protein